MEKLQVALDNGRAKMAELIEVLFGVVSGVGPSKHLVDGHELWCHLANMVERLCAAAISVSTTSFGAWPVRILFWAVLLLV